MRPKKVRSLFTVLYDKAGEYADRRMSHADFLDAMERVIERAYQDGRDDAAEAMEMKVRIPTE